MDERPKLKLELTKTDRALEIFGWVSIFAIWALPVASYTTLPETIPIHYNIAGQADNFGEKSNLFILPVVATILFIALTILNKFPHLFNYPAGITQHNALKQYAIATRFIRYLKFIIVMIFGSIVLLTIRNANGKPNGPVAWFLPLILGLIFLPLAYFVIKLFKQQSIDDHEN